MVQHSHLQAHMGTIRSTLRVAETSFDSLVSNPVAVEQLLGSKAKILPWINDAFAAGYEATFQFLLGSCIVAILITTLLPKHKKTHQKDSFPAL